MAEISSNEREATDQPPPINAPWTPRQIWGLVIPGVLLLGLIGVVLWGTLSSIHPAAPTPVATLPAVAPPSATAVAQAPPASPTGLPPASPTTPPVPTETQAAAPSPTIPPTAQLAPSPVDTTVPPTNTAQPNALDNTPTPAATQDAESASPTSNPQPLTPNPQALAGRRIALDPGHGPRGDLGAVLVDPDTGKLILAEDELNLDVGLRLATLLRARGAAVVLTRETKDSFTAPWPPDTNGDGIKNGASDDLQERIDIMNDFHAEVFLSIHANSSANPAKRQGIQALYCAGSDCPFPDQEKHLGKLVLDQLEAKLAAVGDPITQRELRNDLWQDTPDSPLAHLFLLGPANPPTHPRAARMPGVIVESLYVTSPTEAAMLKQDKVRQAIALAYADGLQDYLTGK